jgi:hypothetical protein
MHNVKLGADVVGTQVPNKANGAGVKGGRSHVLPLLQLRLPLGYLAPILEPRLEDVDGATPGMCVNKSTEGGL